MKGMLNGVLALISLAIAAFLFYSYTRSTPPNNLYLVLFIIFALAMIVFGGLFLSGRINKSEDIHITE